MQGSALNKLDLRKANIMKANKFVILSPSIEEININYIN